MQFIRVISEELKIKYDIEVRNRFSFIKGNSGTGKTKLVEQVSLWLSQQERGIQGLVNVSSSLDVKVLRNKESISLYKDCIVLVDEPVADIIKTCAKELISTNSYYIIIYRELINLPYGVYDIYSMESKNLNDGYTTNYLKPLYDDMIPSKVIPDVIITEDSSSGYNFYLHTLSPTCISAKGKTRIIKSVKVALNKGYNTILIIADEVGYGYDFVRLLDFLKSKGLLDNVYLWLPKSFEYLLLNSGVFQNIDAFLINPYDFWNLDRFSTIELCIEKRLSDEMKNKYGLKYSKSVDINSIFENHILAIYSLNFDNYQDLLKDEFK